MNIKLNIIPSILDEGKKAIEDILWLVLHPMQKMSASDGQDTVGTFSPNTSSERQDNSYLLKTTRDGNAAGFGNVKINAALLKLGVFGKMSCVSEDDQMDRMMQAKVLRLDHKNINRIDGLELVDKVERIYLQGNRIRVIENFDFLSKLCWLNLSDNCIESVENLKHLVQLQVLDLSKNNIETSDDGVIPYEQLPRNKLRALYLYGNPCSYKGNYRSACREHLPRLISLDGTRVDINVDELELDGDHEEDLSEEKSGGEEEDGMFQCDGTFCGKSIIYGTHFQTSRDNVFLDLCIACAYETALKNSGGGPPIIMVELGGGGDENASPVNTTFTATTQSQLLSKLDFGMDQARRELKKKREGIAARSSRRLNEMKDKRKAFEQRKMEANEKASKK